MLESTETGVGLDVVLWLQSTRSPFIGTLVQILNQLGLEIGYILSLAIIYLILDKRLGKRLIFTFILGLVIAVILKEVFQRPRPYHLSGSGIVPLFEAPSFGLPSGHVLVSILFWGYLAFWAKRRLLTLAVILYIGLQSWGRMVAGVHYPQDIVAGILFGLISLWIFIRVADELEDAWDSQSVTFQTSVVLVVGILASIMFWNNSDGQLLSGVFLGGGIGFIIEERWIRFSTDGTTPQRVVRTVLGVIITLGVLFGLRVLFEPLTPAPAFRILCYALTALVGLTVYPRLAMRIGITEQERE